MRRSLIVWTTVVVLIAVGHEASATVYDVILDNAFTYYGTLNQNDLSFSRGCSPSASTNALAYLQNAYSGVYGSGLLPIPGYDGLTSVAETLAGHDYMKTIINNGTYTTDQYQGLYKYIEEQTPGVTEYRAQLPGFPNAYDWWLFGSEPSWIENVFPTWQFIYESLSEGAPVLFNEVSAVGGHSLAAYGFTWDDANDDGIMQYSEGARIRYVNSDPPDTDRWPYWYVTLWQDGLGHIRVGGQGSEYYLMDALAISPSFLPVPEPTSLVLWSGLGIMGLVAARRRRRAA